MAYDYHGKSADWQQEPLNKQVMDYIYSKIHVDYKYIVKSARSFNAINRNFIKYDDSDFEDYDDLDLLETKFEYKQRGRDLEKSKEWDKVIEYYNSLKDNYLFINDYYPYRRLCIIHRRRKDPEDDLNTIISFMKAEIYCNDHQLNWFKGKIAELTSILDMNADEINSLVEKYERNRKYYKKSQNTPAPMAERIVEKDGEVRLVSNKKYDSRENLFNEGIVAENLIREGRYVEVLDYLIYYYGRDEPYKSMACSKMLKLINNPEVKIGRERRGYSSYTGLSKEEIYEKYADLVFIEKYSVDKAYDVLSEELCIDVEKDYRSSFEKRIIKDFESLKDEAYKMYFDIVSEDVYAEDYAIEHISDVLNIPLYLIKLWHAEYYWNKKLDEDLSYTNEGLYGHAFDEDQYGSDNFGSDDLGDSCGFYSDND